ncbi:MAG: hypothetical protein ACW98Y_10320 [Candidatus Thorarchaeota archaeon]
MLIIPPNYTPITLLISGIIFFLYFSSRTKKIRKTINSLIIILIATMIGIPIQAWCFYDSISLNSGTANIDSLDIELNPSEVHQISNVPNWYSASDMVWVISSNPNNVTFYLLEESKPGERISEVSMNTTYFFFKLPYRITDTLQIANWTICLENPSDDESTYFEAQSVMPADGESFALWSVYLPYALPFVTLICMYMYIPMIIAYQSEIAQKIRLENKALLALTLLLLGIYLYLSSPLMSSGVSILYGIPIAPLIVDMLFGYFLLSKRQKLKQVENI